MRGKVLKFGGTSLGTAARIGRVAETVVLAQREGAVVAVVSAMAGVTDRLAAIADLATRDLAAALAASAALADEHSSVATELGTHAAEVAASIARTGGRVAEALTYVAAGAAWARDAVLASGEAWSAALLASATRALGASATVVAAEEVIVTNDRHGDAEVDREISYARIRARVIDGRSNTIRIVPGFTGATRAGRTTTLGRNASDYSAALVAAALGWPLDIWTDVAGCYSADPRHVAGVRLLRGLSLDDAHRFARAGASVVHARTLEPLLDRPVVVRIVNSFAPEVAGTVIADDANAAPLRGIAVRDELQWRRRYENADNGVDEDARERLSSVATVRGRAVTLASVFDDAQAESEARCIAALREHALEPLAMWRDARDRCVRIALPLGSGPRALRCLHAALFDATPAPIHVAVIGASGRIGGRLIELLDRQRETGAERFRVIALATSRAAIVDAHGIDASVARSRLRAAPAMTTADFAHAVLARSERPLVVVDCSASAEVVANYPEWLAAGIDIVTPNKLGPSADRGLARAIAAAQALSGARLAHETTVGAQLPLLRTLRELVAAGDRVESIEAVLSGTLSYVLAKAAQGEAVSNAVRAAVANGFAEPHAARDLSGADAARKLVVLLRAAGIDIELRDVAVVPLVDDLAESASLADDRSPTPLLDEPDPARFLDRLVAVDDAWRHRIGAAERAGERWIYRATYARGVARVAPERVPLAHRFARLAPCENAVRVASAYYRDAPLTIAGPGAGIALTAAGVYADLLAVAERYRVEPLRREAGVRIQREATLAVA